MTDPPGHERVPPGGADEGTPARPLPRRARLLACAVLAALALGAWTEGYRTAFTSLAWPDACDYAQLGRQIARGEGMSSLQAFPYVLSWLREHGMPTTAPWPNAVRFVLPPLERAVSFSILGTGDLAAIVPDAVFFVATVVLGFLLGSRLAGPAAGWAAAVVLATGPTALAYALSGLSETGAGFLVLAVAAALVAVVDRRGGHDAPSDLARASLLGATLGLAYLQRSNLVVGMLPCLAVIVAGGPGPWRRRLVLAAACAASALVVALPWLVRNAVVFGSPTFSLNTHRMVSIALLRSDPFYQFQLVDPGRIVADHLADLLPRLHPAWLDSQWRDMFGPELWWFLPALLVVVPAPMPKALGAVRWYVFGSLLLNWLATTPIDTVPRYYQPFAPVAVVLVLACAVRLVARLHARLAPALVAAACAVVAASWLVAGPGAAVEKRDPTLARWDAWIAGDVPRDGIVASDQSWFVAWQGDRPSVRFYGDVAQLAELERTYAPVAAVWLSRPSSTRFARSLAASPAGRRWTLSRVTPDGISLWLPAP